jgi:predicted DNA-binding transcriptional regulator AlpA
MLDFVQEVAYPLPAQNSARPLDVTECATVSLAQAAGILGIHRSTAWDLYKRGDFPIAVLKIGNRLRVTKANLEAFLKSGIPQSDQL